MAVCYSVLLTHSNHLLGQGESFPSAFTSGTAWGFWVLAVLTVIAFVAALLLIKSDEVFFQVVESAPAKPQAAKP